MDTDSGPTLRPGGTVEPANRATVARQVFQMPNDPSGTRYELRDPFAEVTYRVDSFKEMVAKGEFLEWAHVFGHRYGTPHGAVEKALSEGRDVLFDIDWQGAQQLYQLAGGDVVRVFIFPPSMEELERRLRLRGTDSDEVIDARMARAAAEISHWDGYDYVLVNDDVEQCFEKVSAILVSERLKRSRQTGLIGFVRGLMK